jgi:hypothetical protein
MPIPSVLHWLLHRPGACQANNCNSCNEYCYMCCAPQGSCTLCTLRLQPPRTSGPADSTPPASNASVGLSARPAAYPTAAGRR